MTDDFNGSLLPTLRARLIDAFFAECAALGPEAFDVARRAADRVIEEFGFEELAVKPIVPDFGDPEFDRHIEEDLARALGRALARRSPRAFSKMTSKALPIMQREVQMTALIITRLRPEGAA